MSTIFQTRHRAARTWRETETYIAVAIFFAAVSAAASPAMAWTDPCLPLLAPIHTLQAKIAAVQTQIANLDDVAQNPHLPEKLAQLEAELATYKQNLGIAQAAYDQCEANNPPPSPPPSVPPFDTVTGTPDPQLAIGKNYLVSVSTTVISFYQRNTDGSVDPSAPVFTRTALDLFEPLIFAMNQAANDSRDLPFWCNRGVGPGCIVEAYDTRVFYDGRRDRFWIATALRHKVWRCDPDNPDNPDPNNLTGYTTEADKLPDGTAVCHPGNASRVHRYIAVAVTKSGESPSDTGFFQWTLVDEYADWPQMTVTGDWLILNHRGEESGSGRKVFVFNARDLANGTRNREILTVPFYTFGPGTFNTTAYDWTNKEDVDVEPDTAIYLTTMHGATGGVAYLVAGYQNYLVIYGLIAQTNNPDGRPNVLTPAAVNLGDGRWVFDANNPPVWRHGRLYYAYETCRSDDCSSDKRIVLRTLKVPVHHAHSGNHGVYATSKSSSGYKDRTIGLAQGDHHWYSRPVVEVNRNDDLVIVFSRLQKRDFGDGEEYPSVRYSVLYHDRNRFSASRLVVEGTWLPVDENGKRQYPWDGGVIDLGGAGIDPLGGTQVWLSHAYGDGRPDTPVYTGVITAVVP